MFLFPEGHCLNEIHDPGSGLQPRNSGLKGPHTYAQPFFTSNGTWPTSLVWTTPPRPQLAFEGVFKHLLNPVRVRVFFISLHKRAFVSSALLSALQRMQQYIRFGSQIT